MTEDVCDFVKVQAQVQQMYVSIVMEQENGIKLLNHM